MTFPKFSGFIYFSKTFPGLEIAVLKFHDFSMFFMTVRTLLWRDLNVQDIPSVYDWQVLPFGTTCSPCCAVFALQKHILDNSKPGDDIRNSVLKSFYVDNCLQSFTSVEEAKCFVDRIRNLLADGGFELRQWSSNAPSTISHLSHDSISDSAELWILQGRMDIQESTLGLL